MIRVRDTGVGIPTDDLPRLFQQGFSTDAGGHGLGLHMSQLTVEGMGGTLTAESAGPGAGATFTVRLPLARRSELPTVAA
jgi:signal transduction histidine kinase